MLLREIQVRQQIFNLPSAHDANLRMGKPVLFKWSYSANDKHNLLIVDHFAELFKLSWYCFSWEEVEMVS